LLTSLDAYRRRKAVSGIVAGLILFVMLFTVGTGYFLWINTNNGIYSQAQAARALAVQQQQNENLALIPAFCSSGPCSGDLTFTAQNIGGSPATIINDFVSSASGTCTTSIFLSLNPGTTSSSKDTGCPYTLGTTATLKVLTQRGNVFSFSITASLLTPPLSVSTTLSSTLITAGSSVTDTALVSGGISPSGSVSFFYSTANICPNAGATQVGGPGATFALGSGGSATSSPPISFSTGTYYWYATYNGDSNNPVTTSPCEQLVVISNSGGGDGGGTNVFGSFELTFTSFRAFYANTPTSLGDGWLVGGYYAYVIPSTTPMSFQVLLTNVDPNGKSLTVNFNSILTFTQNGVPGTPSFSICGDLRDTSPFTSGPTCGAFPPASCSMIGGCLLSFGQSRLFNFTGSNSPSGPGGGGGGGTLYGVFLEMIGSFTDGTPFVYTIPFTGTFASGAGFPSSTSGPIVGQPGQSFTVSLSKFTATSTAYWVNPDGTTQTIGTGTSSSITFTIPTLFKGLPLSPGYYQVLVTDGTVNAYATVSVPAIVVTPNSAPHGVTTVASITGSSFPPSTGTYTYCLSTSKTTISCVAGTTGTFTPTVTGTVPTGKSLSVPNSLGAGTYYVIVYSGARIIAYTAFTLT
jgi:hypothetical protein